MIPMIVKTNKKSSDSPKKVDLSKHKAFFVVLCFVVISSWVYGTSFLVINCKSSGNVSLNSTSDVETSDLEKFMQENVIEEDLRRKLSCPVPYPWFSTADQNVTILDNQGQNIPLKYLGQFTASKGEHVFHYDIKKAGRYTLNSNGQKVMKFTVHPEKCFCPEEIEKFRERYQCHPEDRKIVDAILSKWLPKSISLEDFEDFRYVKWKDKHVRVSIINNTLHLLESKKFTDNRVPSFHRFLKSLLRKVRLPDVEFYHIYAEDYSFVEHQSPSPPIISQGSTDMWGVIPGPTSHHINWIFKGTAVQHAASGIPWENRKSVAYFRGSRTGPNKSQLKHLRYNSRVRLAMMARNLSSVDAKVLKRLGNFKAYHSEKVEDEIEEWMVKEGLGTGKHDKEGEANKYKYIINPDGNVSPWRMYYQLPMGAVLLRQKSPYKEWWYDHLLKDKVNYVEVGKYFHDLSEIMKWLLENDDKAENIARNAFLTWRTRLRVEDAYCWVAEILFKLKDKLAFEPSVRENMATGFQDAIKERKNCRCQ